MAPVVNLQRITPHEREKATRADIFFTSGVFCVTRAGNYLRTPRDEVPPRLVVAVLTAATEFFTLRVIQIRGQRFGGP